MRAKLHIAPSAEDKAFAGRSLIEWRNRRTYEAPTTGKRRHALLEVTDELGRSLCPIAIEVLKDMYGGKVSIDGDR